jgi:cellulose synthase operon protein C
MKLLCPTQPSLQRYLLVPLLSCAVGLATVPAMGQTNVKAAGYYEDALVRYDKKDIPGAIIQLKNALQIDPNQLPVQLLLGKALMRNGDVAAAEVAFKEALRLGVNRAEVVAQLGQAYVAQGKHKLVMEERVFALEGLPPAIRLDMHLLKATVRADLGDPPMALQEIDEARAIDSRNERVWLAEVPIRIRARQFKEANAAADMALSLMPSSAASLYQKGEIAHVQGDLRAAADLYDRALLADKSHVEARVARIGIALDQGRFSDAAKDVAELQAVAPNEPRGAYMRALLAERDGDMATSLAAMKKVTELLDPVPIDYIRFRPQLLMLNGLSHFGLNQSEKAKQYLEAFQRVQNNSPVSKLLARIYMTDGNPGQAVSVLEPYLRAQPTDGQALTLMAAAHMAQGRHSKATALMQEALKTQDKPEFRTALGLSLVGDGQSASGQAELEAAFKKDPKQIHAAITLVQLYLRGNQAAKAVPVAQHLVKSYPTSAPYHDLLGMAQGQSGNIAAARNSFEKAISLDGKFLQARVNLSRLEIASKAYGAASQRLEEILKADPKNGEAMVELAIIADRNNKKADAQRWLEKARDSAGPRDQRWDLELVDFHLRYGEAGAAMDAAKAASAKTPDDVKVLLAYSRAALASGDTLVAKSALTSATRYAEYDAPMQFQIAGLQMLAKNLAGAAYSLEKALSSRPSFLPALALMAEVELRQGEYDKAEKRAKQILAQNPKLAVGHSLLGDIAMARGQPSAAVDAYRRAYQVEPGTKSVMRLFRALSSQNGGRPALQLAEQWLKTNPKDLQVYKALADGEARAGNFVAARAAYQAALKLKPDDAEALNNLANVQLRLKEPGAIKTAEAALASAPGNALITDTLGWALFQNGQTERALQMLRDARLRQPGNPDIRYHLAAVLAQTGRTNEAREELDAALKLGVDFEGLADARKLQRSLQ